MDTEIKPNFLFQNLMHPLEIDHILDLVLGYLPHRKNLLACRGVSRQWCELLTPRLTNKGVRLGLDYSTIQIYYNVLKSRDYTLAPCLDLNIYIRGNKVQNDDTIQFALLLITDTALDPSRKIKSICLDTYDDVGEEQFWKLVEAAAPHLEDLSVQGIKPVEQMPVPPPPVAVQAPDTAVVTYPRLIRAHFDLRRYGRQNTPQKFHNIVNNAPKLESVQLIKDDTEPVAPDLSFGAIDFIPNIRQRGATWIRELEVGIYINEERLLGNGIFTISVLAAMTITAAHFTQLKCLKIHQHFNYSLMGPFLRFMSNTPTLTSFEYHFLRRTDVRTSELNNLPFEINDQQPPPLQLNNITHFGFGFGDNYVASTELYEYVLKTRTLKNQIEQLRNLKRKKGSLLSNKGKKKEIQDLQRQIASIQSIVAPPHPQPPPDLPIPRVINEPNFLLFTKHVLFMSRLCPNIASITADMHACSLMGGMYIPEEDESEEVSRRGKFRVGTLEQRMFLPICFRNVKTLTVKVKVPPSDQTTQADLIKRKFKQSFAAKMMQGWSAMCPLLNKLVLNFHSKNLCALHEEEQYLTPGSLATLLNIRGITNLELHNFRHSWLLELLKDEAYPISRLRENLQNLVLLTPTFKIHKKCEQHQTMPTKHKLRNLHELIDSFQQLQSVTLELDTCMESFDILELENVQRQGRASYKGTQIQFVEYLPYKSYISV